MQELYTQTKLINGTDYCHFSSNFESMAAERDQGSDLHNESISSTNSRYLCSSDDEYRTASETSASSRIQSNEDYFEWGEEEGNNTSKLLSESHISPNYGSPPTTASNGTYDDPNLHNSQSSPSSPPLARTPISRVKGACFPCLGFILFHPLY